uniref:Uncharacterized protein n=1 Tax=Anas platyrhynchos platyrhynchos TaxID=8840 RepID=A0A493TP75_ANAPP
MSIGTEGSCTQGQITRLGPRALFAIGSSTPGATLHNTKLAWSFRTFFMLVTEQSPHQLYKWSLIRWNDQTIIKEVTTAGAPSFLTSLCQLAPISPCLNQKGFYFCPSSNPGRGYCDYPNSYYCAYWGCETIASDWSPGAGQDQFLTVGYGPYGCTPPSRDWSGGIRMPYGNCEQLYVNVTNPTDPAWLTGQTWGVRYWEPGADRGGLIFIKKEKVKNLPQGVGPNKVLEGPEIKIPPLPVATMFNAS